MKDYVAHLSDYVTKQEAAEIAGVTERTIDRWTEDGRLTPYRWLGDHNRVRLKRSAVKALIPPWRR